MKYRKLVDFNVNAIVEVMSHLYLFCRIISTDGFFRLKNCLSSLFKMVLLPYRYFNRINLYRNYQFISGIRLCSTTKDVTKIQTEKLSLDGFDARMHIWQKLKTEHDERILSQPSKPLQIRIQNGQTYEGISNQTTPFSIYQALNDGSVLGGLVASVNGQLWDMNRPLEADCSIELLTFENPLAKEVFWRSSAHMLGAAIEQLYGNVLCSGLATSAGFYYDVLNGNQKVCS